MARLVIYGAGGFGRQIIAQHRESISGIVDDKLAGQDLLGIPIRAHPPHRDLLLAVADPHIRAGIASRLDASYGTLIAPTALIAEESEIGEGSVFCEYTMAVGFCRVGKHFQCNVYSYVAHDCEIGDFVTFAPRVSCNGNVTIGDRVYVGTGAIIKQGVTIGDDAFIGMGCLVSKDVPAGARVIGGRILSGNPQVAINPCVRSRARSALSAARPSVSTVAPPAASATAAP